MGIYTVRGKFDPSRPLKSRGNRSINGHEYQNGEAVPEGALDARKRRILWEQRFLEYDDRPTSGLPPENPPLTRPVSEVVAERKARAPEFEQALQDDQAEVPAQALSDMAEEDAASGLLEVPTIPDDWQSLHWKSKVKLAEELGGEASNKDEAEAVILAELDRRG